MSHSLVRIDVKDRMAFLTLDNPPAHCLSSVMAEDLNDAFGEVLGRDDVGVCFRCRP
jgi:enoyl-CoA hydratase/carnithine racemase